jgi:transcriptional regulator with XRE-family HTH domain
MPKQLRDTKLITAVGRKVRALRIERGLSQARLSYQCEIELSQINRIELGKINTSISHLGAIAKALGVQPKDLLDV